MKIIIAALVALSLASPVSAGTITTTAAGFAALGGFNYASMSWFSSWFAPKPPTNPYGVGQAGKELLMNNPKKWDDMIARQGASRRINAQAAAKAAAEAKRQGLNPYGQPYGQGAGCCGHDGN